MNNFIEWILHPQAMIQAAGAWAVVVACLIVFAETGLLVGFFLPGDSLLFVSGMLIASGDIKISIWLFCALIMASAWLGDQLGYWIGRRTGPAVFKRPNSKVFNHKNVERAHIFFERYGARAVILAHFVAIMRTFVPVTAGVAELEYAKFLRYNIIGVIGWAWSIPLLGLFLGKNQLIAKNVEIFTAAVVVVSFIPVILEWVKRRRAR